MELTRMKTCQTSNNNKNKRITPSFLSASILFLMQTQALALQNISEDDMRQISGQDGIAITAEMGKATIDKITWQDGTNNATGGSLVFGSGSTSDTDDSKKITIKHPNGTSAVSTKINVQTGSNSNGVPAMKLDIGMGKAQIDIPNLSVCKADGSDCMSFGALAVTNSGTETQFSLITTGGLFNEKGSAKLKTIIDDLSVAIKQKNGTPETTNQLILGNMFANITAEGKLFVKNKEGLRFIGTVSFDKSTLSGSQRDGLEVLVQHQKGTNAVTTLGKIAINGNMTDVNLAVRGVKDTASVTDLGFKNGTNGIAMRVSGNFFNDATNINNPDNFMLKIGDKNSMGLTGWKNITNAKSFDSGNVYLNIVPSDTQSQTLAVNNRLTKTDGYLNDAETNATYLTRNFIKEIGDTATTPFGTTGKKFVSKNGFVIDQTGANIKAFDGLTRNYSKGIVNKDGQYLSVKSLVKDGYVAEGNEYVIPGSGNGNGTTARFKTIFTVNPDGTTSGLYLSRITDRRFSDQTTAGLYHRPNRQVRVWVNQGDNNVIVAPYGAGNGNNGRQGNNVGGLGNNNHADAYHKAINLADTSNANNTYRFLGTGGGNNLTGANSKFPFRINSNGEVINQSGVLLLQRHSFNTDGFLVVNPNGTMNVDGSGSTTGNGAYVYEYTYALDEANNQLVLTHKLTGDVKRIDLVEFDKGALQPVSKTDYNMTNETVSGDGGTTKADQSISVNVRDMNLQAYATKTQFTEKTGSTIRTDMQNWAVAPVLYDVNANMLLYPKKLNATNAQAGYTQAGEAIGYKMVATTKGSNGDTDFNQANATRTTGFLLTHDDQTDNSKTRYLGVRHMDSLIRAQGDIQITGDGLALTAKDFLFAFRGELAAGKMPTTGETFKTDDRLAVLEGRIKGDIAAKIKPVSEGIGFDAKVKLANGNFGTNTGVRISMPDGNSSINMSEITGTVKVDGSVSVVNTSSTTTNFDGAVRAKMTATLNPDSTTANPLPEQDLRIKNISVNTNPVQSGGNTLAGTFDPYQDIRVGEMAFSKNTIYSEITLSE